MTVTAVLGVDIGTSSSKGVLVDLSGRVLRSSVREHRVDRPRPGWVEMDGRIWWDEFVALTRDLLAPGDAHVVAVGVSGMGPCVLLTDGGGTPLRPAILYGVDTRSTPQIARLTERLGAEEILRRCGSTLSTQAAGAKVAWVADAEPELFGRARRLFMPSSWLVFQLTGRYLLDQHSASQCTPLYDSAAQGWYRPWAEEIAPELDLPELRWPGDVAGQVTAEAAATTGLSPGTPVVTGTIDAWSEAVSVGAQGVGDLMLMYGTTMFLVHTVPHRLTSPSLWGTVGALPGTRNLAGGMATSGAITGWLRELFDAADYPELLRLAARSGPGARGLLMLPFFAGERTPLLDPDARGVIAGLTLSHDRGDIYRAALEATGLGVRHNIETIEAAGGDIRRVVAVGGGTRGDLWTQIVSDITGREQHIPSVTIGASYGAAFLAAGAVERVDIHRWNPIREIRTPRPALAADYDELYRLYRELYVGSKSVAHALAARQARLATTPQPGTDDPVEEVNP
ncbi:FGGY-family carbohydrate kinase [Micromonospora peucetia]|uniref:FGGY-family carbohydrate kinase n=1 Tax=Micromonospora peucetia TaxID=47871 RepID=A0A1C6W2K6_9ACTN|nr:FGGY-family carbohydrate kinase [Micromonospora peucetia]MCX4391212.1 FGGY-family carbohydrate kinase [Micromonospora peucetia]WSA32123.1 FGGY-family carbohydrate kinase [Micromonospora peucetia]SCL72815.1 xylulokinase [Micromonospora peucetia]